MSLAARLAAFAQAVGADIKDLRSKVATSESYIQAGGGASLTGNGVLSIGAITQASNPAPFSRNADGTLTCVQDGVYQVNAVINCSSGLAAGTNIQYQINVNGVAVGYTTNAPVWPHTTLPWLGKVLAGQVVSVYVVGIGTSGQQCSVVAFSAARVQVGPQGPKGDLGGVLGANSFRQLVASAPAATSNWRTILVSATNEMDPTGAFTRNADGSVTVRDAGWYSVSATFRVVTVAALCTFALTDALNAPGNPFATDTKSLSPNYSNSMGADNYFAAGAKIYPNVWTDVSTQIELTYFAVSRLGGTKGDKGDPGYALMAAIGGPVYVNAAAGWNQLPLDPAAAMSTTDGTPDFTRNASGSITFNKAGTYDISATMGNASAAQPTTATMDCRLIVGPVGVVNPDTTVNALTVERRQAVAGDYTICSLSGQVTVVAGQSLAAWLFVAVAVNGVGVSHFGITRQGGPQGAQGPKGDPGGINVLTTLDWNTATTSNFYKSTNDFLQKTLHGPGDTLNPPYQAGIVTVHDSGELTQRVWDLDSQVGYTRYRAGDGTWSAWAADLSKPPVLTGQIVGAPTPVEGDERYFQTAAMLAQGVIWKFRYNKAQNKWHFVGGSDFLFAAASLAANAGASTIDATNLAFTVVLAGSYDVSWGARMYQNPSGPSSGNILLFADQMRGASAITSPGMDLWAGSISGQTWSTVVQNFKTFRFDPVQNGDVIRLRSQSINYNAAIESPIMRIKPVSVLM
jgi:hypothetical protein